jgi:hypothetical protein
VMGKERGRKEKFIANVKLRPLTVNPSGAGNICGVGNVLCRVAGGMTNHLFEQIDLCCSFYLLNLAVFFYLLSPIVFFYLLSPIVFFYLLSLIVSFYLLSQCLFTLLAVQSLYQCPT